MNACPECQAEYYPGALFCEMCGAGLHPAAVSYLVAQKAKTNRRRIVRKQNAMAREVLPPAGSPEKPTAKLEFLIVASQTRLTVEASPITVGRADPAENFIPELDLTPYQGLEKGVSRRHASIHRTDEGVMLVDLQSSNGTWLEGERLVAGYAHRLPPRAAVRFGDLLVIVSGAD